MKQPITVIAFLLMASIAFAVNVDRSMPSSVSPSSAFTVSFTINPEGTLSAFDLADFIPSDWNPNDWSVSDYDKSGVTYDSKVIDYQGRSRNGLHWKFNKTFSSPITLSYTITSPASTGNYEFIAVWTYPGGFNSKSAALSVATPPAQPPAQEQPPVEEPEQAPEQAPGPPRERPDYTIGIIAIILILVIIGAGYMFARKPKRLRE